MTRNLILSLVLIAFLQIGIVYGRAKSCKLRRNTTDGTYFLSCSDGIPHEQRTTTIRKDKKDKKDKKSRRGPQGIQGPPGTPGENGNDGNMGPEGPMGPIGPTGVPGPRGLQGKLGPKGQRGEGGPIGAQGKPGIPGNCLKSPPKYSAKANEYYHCLPGPEGPQGTKGYTGPKGESGVPGLRGHKGVAGPVGPRGRRGPVGMPGLPGTTTRIECMDKYTEWVSQYNLSEAKSVDGFFCPKGQFLQGFKRERGGSHQERYHYVCCGLT